MGLALGFAIGWWFWPVEYTNTAPNALHQAYRDDYILMIATAYEIDGRDLQQARSQLELLDPQDPAAPVIELAERLASAGGSDEDIACLARLAWALRSLPPTPTPHLEGQS
jgi:hypothetical protein